MKQFNLDTWLKDKSRKVVTRRGNSVRIICTDRKHGEDNLPIVFLEESPDGIGEFLLSCKADGTCDNYDTPYDLFFADEEKELTEFEKAIKKLIESCCNEVEEANITNAGAKEISSHILDLARKEIRKEQQEKLGTLEMPIDVTEPYYIKGKQDALKDLPKWKKMPNGIQGNNKLEPKYLIRTDYGFYFTSSCLSGSENNMYIELVELEKLPKEE